MKRYIFSPVLVLLTFAGLRAQQPIQSSVYFLHDQHKLPSLAAIVMDSICATADPRIPWRIAITAHTDADGSLSYNHALSEKRAQTVRQTLEACGITIESLTVECFGENRPAADNLSVIGKARNRRVEMVLSPAGALPIESDISGASEKQVTLGNELKTDAKGPAILPTVYSLLTTPGFTEVDIDPSLNQWVSDSSGLKVFIPAGTFPKGGPLQVRFRSVTKLSDVVRMKYSTSNAGMPLESAGMFELVVTRNGKEVQPLTQQKYIGLFPSTQNPQGFLAWMAHKGEAGFTDWQMGQGTGWSVSSNGMPLEGGRRCKLRLALDGLFSNSQRASKAERRAFVALKKNLDKTTMNQEYMGLAFGWSNRGCNADSRISGPFRTQDILLRSDSTQVVLLHVPFRFMTLFAVSMDSKKEESVVKNVPVGMDAWIVVLRSSKGYLEIARKQVKTCNKVETDFDFTAVTAEEAYWMMNNLRMALPLPTAPMGAN